VGPEPGSSTASGRSEGPKSLAASAPLLVVLAACASQGGGAFATVLIDEAGPVVAAWLRITAAAAILVLLLRGLGGLRDEGLRTAVALGVVVAAMNTAFYASIALAPLGASVTVEFVGPLVVAVLGTRRRSELVWVVLAGAGIALFGSPSADVDPGGLAFALLAGACWAVYIVIGKRLVRTTSGAPRDLLAGLTVSMVVAAALTLPAGAVLGVPDVLAAPWLVPAAFGVALLSSVIPYFLELVALRRLRAATFAVLLSLQPAVAALAGLVFPGQELGWAGWLAVALVVVASAGANRRAALDVPAAP
jgi:inner membrane transporter RhtA